MLMTAVLLVAGGCVCQTSCPHDQPVDFSGLVQVNVNGGLGSGVVIGLDEDGYLIATVLHVVDSGAVTVEGVLAEVVASDPDADTALIRIKDEGQGWTVRELADPVQGEAVVAVGWAGQSVGTERVAYRGHVVSVHWNTGGHLGGAAINTGGFPGMSGGPVFNEKGQVVGVIRGCAGAWGHPMDSTTIIAPAREIRTLVDGLNTGE
jgi:S1-C subfamily serine protease